MEEKEKKDRRERVEDLKRKILSLSPAEREAITASLGMLTIEGRSLSPQNQLMIYFQLGKATVVGGFKQWRDCGRTVRKGEHGAVIFFPVGAKNKETGEVEEAERFYTAVVFDISQTIGEITNEAA